MKGLVGAAIDAGAQMTVSMATGKSFKESLKDMDLTSVGVSFVSSAFLSPGLSSTAKVTKGAKVASIGLNVANAAVDYSVEDGVTSVMDGKNVPETVVDLSFSAIPYGKGAKKVQNAFIKDANNKLNPAYFAPQTKSVKKSLQTRKKYVNSNDFEEILNDLLSFTGNMTNNMIVVFVCPTQKEEKEESKE